LKRSRQLLIHQPASFVELDITLASIGKENTVYDSNAKTYKIKVYGTFQLDYKNKQYVFRVFEEGK